MSESSDEAVARQWVVDHCLSECGVEGALIEAFLAGCAHREKVDEDFFDETMQRYFVESVERKISKIGLSKRDEAICLMRMALKAYADERAMLTLEEVNKILGEK